MSTCYKDRCPRLNYVESLVLVTIVFLELLFDGGWHFLAKPAAKSYRYGDMHEEAFEEQEGGMVINPPHHVQLYKELVNKMGGEFMSLGFIAFMVFCSNQLGLFEFLAGQLASCGATDYSNGCVVLPYTAVDWLHLVELVHVQLFVGMMLYFVLMLGVVRGSVWQIKLWEVLRLRRISTTRLTRSFSATLRNANKDKDLQDYVCLREYLVVQVLEWRQTRPKLFKEVTDSLGMVNLPAEDSMEVAILVEGMVKSQLEANFAFSSYLALNVERAVRDSIELHSGTWISIIVLFTAFALATRFSQVTMLGSLPVVVSLALLIVFTMVVVTRWRHKALAKVSKSWMNAAMESRSIRRSTWNGGKDSPREAPERLRPESTWLATCQGRGSWSVEKFTMRFLQVFLFVISYTFSRTLIAFKDWQENFEIQAPIAAFFAVLFMLLLFLLPTYVPTFLELMALPPFIDKENLAVFFAVIDEGFATRFKHEGSIQEKKRRNSAKGLTTMSSMNSMSSMRSMNSFVSPRLPHSSTHDPSMVAISELVTVLENCQTMEDLSSLRENLENQLPPGVQLPQSRSLDVLNETF